MKKALLIILLSVFSLSTTFAQNTFENDEPKSAIEKTEETTVESEANGKTAEPKETSKAVKVKKIASTKEILKSQKGAFTVEMLFNPLNINNGTLGVDGFRARIFCSDKIAFRLHLGIAAGDTVLQSKIDRSDTDTKRGGIFAFSFIPGLEFHLGNLKRLSPYVGFDLGFGISRAFNAGFTGFTFTVGAVFGVDFYLYKGLYLGAEFALRYNLDTVTADNERRISASNFGFVPVPSIRLGWKF